LPPASLEHAIGSIVTKHVYSIGAESPVIDAARLMLEKDIGSLVVSMGKTPVGIVTERDVLRKVTSVGDDPRKIRVRDIMSTTLITAPTGLSIGEAAKKMVSNKIKRLVVVDNEGNLTGLLTATDLIRWMAKQETLVDSLINYLMHDVI